MKGVLLAGGKGSRLWPITRSISKQLLPVYDKPMVFYPLGTLISARIRDVLVITTPTDCDLFSSLLGDGSSFGMSISYAVQTHPRGLADGLLVAETFINGDCVAYILGDNIFHGVGLGSRLSQLTNPVGATIFSYQVANPSEYGVVVCDEKGSVLDLVEKPSSYVSNLAVPGLYLYDKDAVDYAKTLFPSSRGELEITDLNRVYLRRGLLQVESLTRGTAWLDTGTPNGLHDASSYVRVVEERQGLKICCIEELAWRNGWIDDDQLLRIAHNYGSSDYGRYVRQLVQ